MLKEQKFANDLLNFINKCPTAFHTVEIIKKTLLSNNYIELKETEKWKVKKNGKYFVIRNDSAIIAFNIGKNNIEEKGIRIVGVHGDSPSFKIKPSSEISTENYIKLNTEPYGGAIFSTWLDRPLSIAGKITLKTDDIFKPETKLININKPLLIIPNIAIHLDRDVNKKGKIFNPQIDMLPILALTNNELEKDDILLNMISSEFKIKKEKIIDLELFLYEHEKGKIIGLNNEFISSSRLDDLESVHAAINAFIETKNNDHTNIFVCFDNEEIGSRTKQGADSHLLKNNIERILCSLKMKKEDLYRTLANSFIISADCAHAIHPNRSEKYDITNRSQLNKGISIKISSKQKYTSDSNSIAIYETLCKNAKIPIQKFVNHSNEKGGSTIGPISSSYLDINSIDIGIPLLAMHSIRELCGVKDHYSLFRSLKEFYKYDIKCK